MIWIVGTKVLLAFLLALVAEAVFRKSMKGELAYWLWLGVLVFLLIPPLLSVPVLQFARNSPAESELVAPMVDSQNAITTASTRPPFESGPVTLTPESTGVRQPQSVAVATSSPPKARSAFISLESIRFVIRFALVYLPWLWLLVWVLGSFVVLFRIAFAIMRLTRIVSLAEPASDVQAILRRLPPSNRLSGTVKVLSASGTFSPVAIQLPFAEPQILIPRKLLKALSPQSLKLILIHELAHLKRNDGLSRWLEVIVSVVWWWLPVARWARTRLHQLEELSIDAEVVRQYPESRQLYAQTLLDVEELVVAQPACSIIPAFVNEHPIQQRIQSIVSSKQNDHSPLSRSAKWSIMLAFLLIGAVFATQEAEKSVDRSEVKVAWSVQLDSPSFGGAAVADIDDDGRLEVAFGTYFGDNSVRVLNGENGSEYWRFDAKDACLDASLRFADIDKDNSLELVVPISNLGWIMTFDAKTGNEKWRYTTSPIECTDTPPAIVDLDQDGSLEVVYGTFAGNLHVVKPNGDVKSRLNATTHFVQTGPLAVDVNGGRHLDLICGTFKGDNSLYAIDGATGNRLWKFQVPGKHMGMYHGPSMGDLDGDGQVELVFGTYDGKVYCLDAKSGKKRWEVDTKDSYIMSPTVIADLNQDGRSEVIVSAEHTTVLDADGKMLWSRPCASPGDSATRGASIADLNGDGRLDVASLSGGGKFFVFDGQSGQEISQFDARDHVKHTIHSSSHGVTIADFTGDGKLDVFFVVGTTHPEKSGTAICLSGFEGTGKGWYMLRHDARNTGNLMTKLSSTLLSRIENLKPTKQAVDRPSVSPKTMPLKARRSERRSVRRTGDKTTDAQLMEMAKARGIPKQAVQDALNLTQDFSKHGNDGFRAVCLLVETGRHQGTRCHRLIESTWFEEGGLELMKLSQSEFLPNYGLWTALQSLGNSKSDEVRQYLIKRLKTEQDAGLYMSVALALGTMKESSTVEHVANQVFKFETEWRGVESHLLGAISQMDQTSALPWLRKYVAHAKASSLTSGFYLLWQQSPSEAISLAQAQLKKGDLSSQKTRQVKQFLQLINAND